MQPRTTLALLALTLSAGCHACSEQPLPPAPSASSVALLPTVSYVRSDIRTTNIDIAMGNLEGQLSELRKHSRERPHDSGVKASLVGALLAHGRVVGACDELEEATRVADEAVRDAPGDVDARLLHVRALGSIHRFADALAELDAIEHDPKIALRPGQVRMTRASLLMGIGRYDDALPLVREEVSLNPSTENLHTLALLLSWMGKIDEAESDFVEAENKFRQTTPFPLADLYFDRASMWEREGDLVKATALYRAAFERVPMHVHVATHLAALIAPPDAVVLLEPLAKTSTDPEVVAALGFYRDFVKDGSGDADVARAGLGYDDLMKRLPEAYADHAGWFWLHVGRDPAKALAAAKKNLEVRQTADAFELGLAAALGANDRDAACAVNAKAKSYPYPSKRLQEQLRLVGDCGATPPPLPSASASAAVVAPPKGSR